MAATEPRSTTDLVSLFLELTRVVKARRYFEPGDERLAPLFEHARRAWLADLRRHGALELVLDTGRLELDGQSFGIDTRLEAALSEWTARGVCQVRVDPDLDADGLAGLVEVLAMSEHAVDAEGGLTDALARRVPLGISLETREGRHAPAGREDTAAPAADRAAGVRAAAETPRPHQDEHPTTPLLVSRSDPASAPPDEGGDAATPAIDADEDTAAAALDTAADTATPAIDADEDTAAAALDTAADTATPAIDADEDTATPAIDADEDTATPAIDTDEDTATATLDMDADIATAALDTGEDTATPAIDADEDTATAALDADEDTATAALDADEDTATAAHDTDEDTATAAIETPEDAGTEGTATATVDVAEDTATTPPDTGHPAPPVEADPNERAARTRSADHPDRNETTARDLEPGLDDTRRRHLDEDAGETSDGGVPLDANETTAPDDAPHDDETTARGVPIYDDETTAPDVPSAARDEKETTALGVEGDADEPSAGETSASSDTASWPSRNGTAPVPARPPSNPSSPGFTPSSDGPTEPLRGDVLGGEAARPSARRHGDSDTEPLPPDLERSGDEETLPVGEPTGPGGGSLGATSPSDLAASLLREMESGGSDATSPELVDSLVTLVEAERETLGHAAILQILSTLAAQAEAKHEDDARAPTRQAIQRLATGPTLDALLSEAGQRGRSAERAARVLTQLSPGIAGPLAVRAIQEVDEDRAAQLVERLLSLGRAAVQGPLLELMKTDDRTVLLRTLEIGREVGGGDLVGRISELLRSEDEFVREAAAGALAHLASPDAGEDAQALRALARGLGSADPHLAVLCAECLITTHSARAVEPLAASLRAAIEDGDLETARDRIRALGELGRPEAAAELGQLLTKKSLFGRRRLRELKLAATHALSRLPGDQPVGVLSQAAQSRDAQLRTAAQIALERRSPGLQPDRP